MSDLTGQLRKLAEAGASVCTYPPGVGDPDQWPDSTCDCKLIPLGVILRPPDERIDLGATEHHVLVRDMIRAEHTGCVELRMAYKALAKLQEARQEKSDR